jgi:hypothetical protein
MSVNIDNLPKPEKPSLMDDGTPYDPGTILMSIEGSLYPAFDHAVKQTYGKSIGEMADANPAFAIEGLRAGLAGMAQGFGAKEVINVKGDKQSTVSEKSDGSFAYAAVLKSSMGVMADRAAERLQENPNKNKLVVVDRPGRIGRLLGKKTVARTVATFGGGDSTEHPRLPENR